MPCAPSRSSRGALGAVALAALLVSAVISEGVRAAPAEGDPAAPSTVSHLVISEVMTGGASASDEFAELYNPGPTPQSLDGLELVYVTASGATITRKAVWSAGAALEPGRHVLVANDAGIFAGIADQTYGGGLAAGGGSLALRVVSASSAIDAVGWGTATSTWLETGPASAPPAGSSLERLPGGPLGSVQDTDHNLVDFAVRETPDPQNGASPPVPVASSTPVASDSPPATDSPNPTPTSDASMDSTPTSLPSASPEPTPTSDPTPTPSPPPSATATQTASPTPTAPPPALTVSQARALPDGSVVLVAGVTLTAADFHEGGGYLADATGGIAILLADGSFPRGAGLIVSGTVDDRYAQRTIRASASSVALGDPGPEPEPLATDTGSVGESVEGRLVLLTGIVQGVPTELTTGLAFELDDGSGPIRVLVDPATGIDTSDWLRGAELTVTGVVGQRDSSGTGSEGYRVQPRDGEDIRAVLPPETPEPTPTPEVTATPSPSPSPTPTATPTSSGLVSIEQARRADVGTRLRIRGVVTLPTGLIEEGSAVVADASGAILVRSGSDLGRLRRGQFVELVGVRSTKSGMVSLRATEPAIVLGTQAEPLALRRTTGRVGEADEALLVLVRGLVRDGPRRTGGGGLSFTIDDGSGPFRVSVVAGTAITTRSVPSGAWVELRGVVGQQTTGAQPGVGYRLWPRDRADVTVIARATEGSGVVGPRPTTSGPGTTIPKPDGAPSATQAVMPDLSGSIALVRRASRGALSRGGTETPHIPIAPIPLAASLGGLTGLLVFAWRHGTVRRLATEVQLRIGSDEENESYTPAP